MLQKCQCSTSCDHACIAFSLAISFRFVECLHHDSVIHVSRVTHFSATRDMKTVTAGLHVYFWPLHNVCCRNDVFRLSTLQHMHSGCKVTVGPVERSYKSMIQISIPTILKSFL